MKKLVDHARVKERAEHYRDDMTRFLRDLIKIGGESTEEKEKALRIKEEMEKLGFDKAEIDGLGNVYGWMATANASLRLMRISTPSVSVKSQRGILILMRDMRTRRKSAAAAHPISWAAWYLPYTGPSS